MSSIKADLTKENILIIKALNPICLLFLLLLFAFVCCYLLMKQRN